MDVQVNTGSSATRNTASRNGAGKVKHVDVRELWVQCRVAGDSVIEKVKGEKDMAGIYTEHVDRRSLQNNLASAG